MKTSFHGVIVADHVELRFPFSGKVLSVNKKSGDIVKHGESIVSLDRTLLQNELDQALASYERTRADFEIFKIKSKEDDDIAKHLQTSQQASLNRAVKEVENAKYRLDQSILSSPVNGVINEMEGYAAGIYITPGSFPIRLINLESIRCVFDVAQKDVEYFSEPRNMTFTVNDSNRSYEGITIPVGFGKKGVFPIFLVLSNPSGLLPGTIGSLRLLNS